MGSPRLAILRFGGKARGRDHKRRIAAVPSSVLSPGMVIVEELGQLLAQALVSLAFVAENHGTLEQDMLKLLRKHTPKFRGGRSEDEKITILGLVGGNAIGCPAHQEAQSARLPGIVQSILYCPTQLAERPGQVQVPRLSSAKAGAGNKA